MISALLSRRGSPAEVVRRWLEGHYELIVSPKLLDEFARAAAYPKLRKHLTKPDADEFLDVLRGAADLRADPNSPPAVPSADPGDDYLISLAQAAQAVVVTGDRPLLDMKSVVPAYTPAELLELLDRET